VEDFLEKRRHDEGAFLQFLPGIATNLFLRLGRDAADRLDRERD
jgi:hypothetical protein